MGTMDYSGAEILVEYLVKEQVPYAFGVCGHGIIGFLDAALRPAGFDPDDHDP